jgi:hypothetical protein
MDADGARKTGMSEEWIKNQDYYDENHKMFL